MDAVARAVKGHGRMFIDLTVTVALDGHNPDPDTAQKMRLGHLGTHFDVMNKTFPLEYLKLEGIVFDVSRVANRDITQDDIGFDEVGKGMFVALHSGVIEREGYGTRPYFTEHPQLSQEMIDALLDRGVSIIGVDFAGIRRGKEHPPADQRCADRGAFVVENLCNLAAVLNGRPAVRFTAYTFPVSFTGMSGLPCRVAAEV